MKKIVSLLVCIFLLVGCTASYTTIDANKAKELIQNGATIIDVRESDEYTESHIDGAINIPLDNISSISLNKDTTIIVYCDHGVRSQKAAKELVKLGYTNIYNLDGGLLNWG